MNIVVCIKQVPDTTEVKIDPITNTLVRAGVPSIANPYDLYALELALQLKEKNTDIQVIALSMGPAQATEVLQEAICMGADRGILLSDRAFAGADTLATSYAIAAAIRKIADVGIVLCGKQAIDGDTAQVGPEIAENLSIPQVTYVQEIKLFPEHAVVIRNCEEYLQELKVVGSFLATVEKHGCEPRLGSIRGKLKALRSEKEIWTVKDIEVDESCLGLNGSPTQVSKIFTPKISRMKNEIIQDQAPEIAVDMLLEKLISAKIISN